MSPKLLTHREKWGREFAKYLFSRKDAIFDSFDENKLTFHFHTRFCIC